MAAAINFEVTDNPLGASILFDDTSDYSSIGSYGDIGKTVITITLNDGTVKTFTSFLPTADSHEVTIYASDLGYVDAIPDQIINIEYDVYDVYGNLIGTKTQGVLLPQLFVECLFPALARLANSPGCDYRTLDQMMYLWLRFMGIQAAVERNSGCSIGAIEVISQDCTKLCLKCCS